MPPSPPRLPRVTCTFLAVRRPVVRRPRPRVAAAAASLVAAVVAVALAGPGAAAAATDSVVVAHRGGGIHAPENTLEAVRQGIAMAADKVEVDVQQSKDHYLVLMHDATLARTTDVESVYPKLKPWRVQDLTFAQLERLDAGSWAGEEYAGARIPTLASVLRTLDGTGVGLMLELKSPAANPGVVQRVADKLHEDPYWWTAPDSRLNVVGFDVNAQHAFHRAAPQIRNGVIGTPSTATLASLAAWGCDYANPSHTDVTAAYVARIHAAGLRTIPWTVDDAPEMRRLLADQVDGITTNEPGLLRKIVTSTRPRG